MIKAAVSPARPLSFDSHQIMSSGVLDFFAILTTKESLLEHYLLRTSSNHTTVHV